MKKHFRIIPFANWDKDIWVENDDIKFRVDFDDVDHRTTKRALEKMVKILNEHWRPEDAE
jgi:hypothetical protein